MAFEARYRRDKLLGLASIGLLFVAMGLWMAWQPAGSFEDSRRIRELAQLLGGSTDLAGHGIGWLCVLLGAGSLPLLIKQFRFQGPAIRVDEEGIFWQRWSQKPITWNNIARIEPGSVYNQKLLNLMLHDPAIDPSTSPLGKLARLNRVLGFGQVSISVQGTDVDFDELVQAVYYYADQCAER